MRGEYAEDEKRGRRRRKKGHRLYACIVIFLGILIVLLSVLLLFYVQRIEIKGNEYVEDRQIMQMVQTDRFSVNSLYVCAKYALGRGEMLPSLDSVRVSLKLPWALRVEVREKPIVGYLYAGTQEYAYFDRSGMIVKKDSTYIGNVPCVEGIGTGDFKLYRTIESDDPEIFEEILQTSQELKKNNISAEKIICVDGQIYVCVGKVYINLGKDVTSEKIAQIPPILEKLGKKKGTLHLEDFSRGKATITFRKGEFPEEN